MLRRIIFWIHLYLGLTLGLLASLLGLTGSLLVFSHEFDGWLNPETSHSQLLQSATTPGSSREPAPMQPLIQTLKERFPKSKLQFIRIPQTETGVYEIWLDGGRLLAFADAYSGKLLAVREARGTFPGFLFELHTKLFLGETGKKINGIGGISLLILGLTGLVLWWPRKVQDQNQRSSRRWRAAFTINWRGNPVRIAWDLHRVLGVLTVVFLCLIAATGVSLAFPDAASASFAYLTRDPVRTDKPKSKPVDDAKPVSVDAAVTVARTALPGATATRVTPAAKPTAAIVVRLRFPTEIHPYGTSNVYVDQFTGNVLKAESALDAPPTTRLMSLRYPLHIGRWAGLASRLLQVFLGLVPITLYISGLYIWWSKARRKKKGKKKGGRMKDERRGAL